MLILLLIAFVSGLLTILAPCIWPILPIVLSSSSTGGHRRPLGVTLGILLSFSIFTLSLSYLVRIFGFDADSLRFVAVFVIAFLGLVLLIPPLSAIIEGYTSKLNNLFGGRISTGTGFWGGLITGVSLGIVWAPCAGPILATIAALSATRAVNSQVILITLVYMLGTGIPLFLFATFGSNLLLKSRRLSPYTGRIQQIFGAIMIATSAMIWTGYDRVLQARLLNYFPGYTDFIYKIEQIDQVQKELGKLTGKEFRDSTVTSEYLPDLGKAPELKGISGWINSEPLTIESLRGKVVLIDFWTYSCINCIRTFPYVSRWYDKYKDQGLVIIGVHTPEFEFEKKTQNVQMAVNMFDIKYPVAQDNSYSTWNNFNNSYWPAKYLIDKNGRIRLEHFGEGEYVTTEKAIQTLLVETGASVSAEVMEEEERLRRPRLTPELYLGLNRMEALSSNERPKRGDNLFTLPSTLNPDRFAFKGTWTLSGEMAQSHSGSSLELNFIGNKVFLVITPRSESDLITVFLDGKLVDDKSAGEDIVGGKVKLDIPRLYELINLPGTTDRHLLQLEFGTDGTEVFAFTFG